MFEKLLQKLLKDVIGQFTQQIDTNNLSVGIWSGEIQINKVKLNRNLFKKFNLPINIVFSFINELKIKIPWKSFFSSPLIISIDSVWGLCVIDEGQIPLIEQKHALINSLKLIIANLGKKMLQKLKPQQSDKQSSYIDNILLKMFDNLYLNIKNIHFRFEHPTQKFSFGLIIDAIDIHAVDQKNKAIFVDRSKLKENDSKAIRRKFSLEKLRFYWEPNEGFFMILKQLKERQQFFKNSQKLLDANKYSSLIYILYLDLQGLIIENYTEKEPFYDVQINQQKIQLNLKKEIIEQFLFLTKSLQQILRKTQATKIIETQCSTKTFLFLRDFCDNYLADKDSKLSQKQKEQKLTQMFKVNHDEILQLIHFHHDKLVTTVENIVLNQIGQQKLLKGLDLKQLNLKKMLQKESKQETKEARSKIRVSFVLPKALVYLFSYENKPVLQLNLSNTEVLYSIENASSKMTLNMRSISVLGEENCQLFRLNKSEKQKHSLQFIQTSKDNKISIEFYITKINILYDPKTILSIISFFTFTSIDSKMKNQALDKLQKIESNVTSQIKNTQQVTLKIVIAGFSTIFIHPLHQLMIDSGELRLFHGYEGQKYHFQMEKMLMKVLKNNNESNQIKIIEPFNLIANYEIEQSFTSVEIPDLKITIDRQIYLFMMQFSKIFSGEGKKEMLMKADIVGQIFVKENRWKKTLSMIHRGKIYLWDQDDIYPKSKLRIRKAKQMSKGRLNYIIIGDKTNDIQIAFKTQKEYDSWKEQIENIVEFTKKSERKSSRMSSVIERKPNQNTSESSLNFKLKNFRIELKENNQNIIAFSLENFEYENNPKKISSQDQEKSPNSQSVVLQSLQIQFENKQIFTDVHKENSSFLNCMICENSESSEVVSLIEIEINSFQFNFDPLFLIKINSFLRKQNMPNTALYMIKSQQILDRQDEEKILSRFSIKLKQSIVNFINKKTRTFLCFLSFQELSVEVITKYYQFSIEGKAEKVCLGDLTGYPNTRYDKNKQVLQKILPTNILCSEKNFKSSIDFKYFSISEGSSRYKEKKKEILSLKFNNFRLNFIYQVFFRIFDYIFVQLIGSISSPEFFDEFLPQNETKKIKENNKSDFKKFTKKKDELIRSKALAKMDKKQLEAFLIHGILFYLQLKFTNSTINLVSENINEGLCFNIKSIQMGNDFIFHPLEINSTKCQLLSQLYEIKMSDIMINVVGKEEKTMVTSAPLQLKINIEMFNKDLQYNYLYGENEAFISNMSVIVDIQPCKLSFKTENISFLKKILTYNFSHDDGLDFLMIYDYMDLVPEMKVNLKLISDVFTFQLVNQEEKIIVDSGNFSFKLQNTQKVSQIHAQCQYFVVGYTLMNQYEEVLTSRKNFGKIESRKTSFRNFITSFQFERQNNQSILLFQLKTNKQSKNEDCFISIEEVMVIFNAKFLRMLKKISMKNQLIIPIQKVYKESKEVKAQNQGGENKIRIVMNANKVLFCCKFTQSNEMILALLFTCKFKQNKEGLTVIFPHLESFVSNQQQISGENVDLIKKRTILRPTQVKFNDLEDETRFFVDRIFLKISVNDIQQLSTLYNDAMKKLNQITDNENPSNYGKSSMKSLSNESLNQYEKSKSLISVKHTKTKIFELNTIELMIINDIQQNLIPLIYGNLNLQYEAISSSIKMQFKLDFFNIRNSFWQPLIQTTKLLIKLQPEFRIKMQEMIDFSQEIPSRENRKEYRQFINLNLSTNFIENFYKTITNKSINFTKLYNPQQEIGIDEINSWVIVNQLGEDIICKSIDQKHEVCIPFNESAKIPFLSNIQQAFNPNKKLQDKERSISINIVVGEKLQFKELNVNQLGLKKVMFVYQEQRFSLLKNLVVDISKNVRYLTLSSLLEIENSTNLSIRFFIPIEDRYFILAPQSKRSIPFNLASDQIILQGISQTQQRQPSVSSLTHSVYAKQEDNLPQERTLEELQKEKIVHFNFMSLKVKTRVERMKKIFSLEPLYLLKNYLPQEMTIVLMDKVQQSMLNQYFIQGTNHSQNASKIGIHPIYHEINDASVSFYVDGYQWTNFELFSGKRKVLLKDFSGRQFQLRIYRDNQVSKTSQITFYYPLLVKNKTLSSLKVHSSRFKKSLTKQLEKNKSEILISRQIILEVDGGFSEQVYLRNYTEFFTFRKILNNLKTFSKYFIYKNLEKINEDVTITEFKIFNKYLIRNNTKNDIILRPVPGKMGEIETIKKGQVTDLLFFEVESRISISSMFQFCPKDNEYEWSHPFNLLIANETTFFIRSRYQFKKLKHYFLEIRKTIESCLQIVFTEIDRDEEIPYILVNETQSKQIFIKNMLQNIQPGQSSYFNWENPFENNSELFLQIKDKKKDNKIPKFYTLDLNTKETSILISSRSFAINVQVEIIIEPTRKKIVFNDEDVRGSTQKQDYEHLQALIQLPLRISLINNSITPVVHVVDISFNLKLQKVIKGDQIQVINLDLGSIQVDNQANHNPLYPVILSTEMNLTFEKGKNQTLQIQAKEINLKIEEDFFRSIIQLKTFFENLLTYQSTVSESRLSTNDKKSQFFISKLILPRIIIYLEVQTKSFSIETTVNLQKPQVCSFPWKEFPYPIKRIILNIISHLSISPWAFVSSFKKGIQILLTQQSTGRAFQGFFGTVLGAVSNALGGILGFIVGYDVQKVDNLIDGIDQGVAILFRQLKQIPQFQTNACSIGGILEGTGKTLVNIVLKPIKGVLRMTLKISQGIKKTAQFSFDQQTYVKTRKPMVFYNHQEYFLPYSREESKNLQRFKQITGNKLQFFYLVKFFPIPLYLDKMDLLLVISTEYIVVLNLTKRTVLWLVEIAKIVKIQIAEVCKLRILAIQDGKDEKLTLDSYFGTAVQKKKSVDVQMNSNKNNKQKHRNQRRQLVETQYQIWMMNENQAIEVIEMYMKVKKSSKILV